MYGWTIEHQITATIFMSSISATRHQQFMQLVDKIIASSEKDNNQVIEEDARLLQHLYDTYRTRVFELQLLIREYDTLQRLTRVKMRKQQLQKSAQEE